MGDPMQIDDDYDGPRYKVEQTEDAEGNVLNPPVLMGVYTPDELEDLLFQQLGKPGEQKIDVLDPLRKEGGLLTDVYAGKKVVTVFDEDEEDEEGNSLAKVVEITKVPVGGRKKRKTRKPKRKMRKTRRRRA